MKKKIKKWIENKMKRSNMEENSRFRFFTKNVRNNRNNQFQLLVILLNLQIFVKINRDLYVYSLEFI
jgi:hypothetical protein